MNKNVTVVFNKKELNTVLVYAYDIFFSTANIKSQQEGIADYYPDPNLVNCVVLNENYVLDLKNPPASLNTIKEYISSFSPPWAVPPQPQPSPTNTQPLSNDYGVPQQY